tara:strand:+ start:199 stop:300 length:102 start_codon:yes stop_codon:yes gene_type:complete
MISKEEILLFVAHAGLTIGIPALLVVGIYLLSK